VFGLSRRAPATLLAGTIVALLGSAACSGPSGPPSTPATRGEIAAMLATHAQAVRSADDSAIAVWVQDGHVVGSYWARERGWSLIAVANF